MENLRDIFISYSHIDKIFAKKLVQKLESHGVKVWLDEKSLEVGDLIVRSVFKAIEKCSFFAVILSRNSVKSEWVKREIDLATSHEIKGKHVKVLPLLIDECKIPEYLVGKYYADFRISFTDGYLSLLSKVKPKIQNIIKILNSKVIVNLFDPTGKNSLVTKEFHQKILKGTKKTTNDCFNIAGRIEKVETTPFLNVVHEKCGLTDLFKYTFPNEIVEGQTIKYKFTYHLKNTFLENEEFWTIFGPSKACDSCKPDTASIFDSERNLLEIIFPKERPCKSFYEVVRLGNNIVQTKHKPVKHHHKGRVVLIWLIKPSESTKEAEYSLNWTW